MQVNAMPIVKGDKVKVLRGTNKGKEGKVVEVYRKKWVIHIEGLTTEKTNGSTSKIGFDASKVEITEEMDVEDILRAALKHL